MSFVEELKVRQKYIEEVVKKYIPNIEESHPLLFETIGYNLNAGGKRLRPMLLELSYELFGGHNKELVSPFMAAIEMIHTYSLVHDDLPAMDNDDYRRGRKTTHVVYGEDIAILTGDALLNLAFETSNKAFQAATDEELRRVAAACSILSRKAGVEGMIGGQVIDMKDAVISNSLEAVEKRSDRLKLMYRLKTSALIEGAMMIGAALAGADEEEILKIEELASLVGMAFQIQDDILEVTSSEEVLGKPVNSDEKNQKITYVSLWGLEKAKEDVRDISNKALCILDERKGEKAFLTELIISLITREK